MFGIKQENGLRWLAYDNNGMDTSGISANGKYIWLRSVWDANGISHYAFSVDGRSYRAFDSTYQLTWGSYRRDSIGIFNFKNKEYKGHVDVDWFQYDYGKLKVIACFTLSYYSFYLGSSCKNCEGVLPNSFLNAFVK